MKAIASPGREPNTTKYECAWCGAAPLVIVRILFGLGGTRTLGWKLVNNTGTWRPGKDHKYRLGSAAWSIDGRTASREAVKRKFWVPKGERNQPAGDVPTDGLSIVVVCPSCGRDNEVEIDRTNT
jgi:hypothetical protein